MKSITINLPASEMPRQWYNLGSELSMQPPVDANGNPIGPEALARIFPMNLIEQEMCPDPWIDIPEPILDIISRWRPTPLRRAVFLEQHLKTPARIYYKDESVSPAGSHKPNSAVAQAWYNKQFGIENIVTETGAGQWGAALSFACKLIGLNCKVFMVRISFDQKPFRKVMMQLWGGKCVASPSMDTEVGRRFLAQDPNTPGSLGIAIGEAIEAAVSDTSGKTRYSLGSVLNHVMLHQTVIGLEAKKQLKLAGEKLPDVVIGCAGGGSNFAGLAFPFTLDKIHGANIDIIPVEPEACPTITRGPFAYDYGDVAGQTPLIPMYTLGHGFIPRPIHAGGLRYHGMAPMVSQAVQQGLFNPRALRQMECYEAAMLWANTEGPVCAPETSHAIAAVIQEAIKAREEQREKVIIFSYSGHGLLDLAGYEKYMAGELSDYVLPEEDLQASLQPISNYPKPKQAGR
ncbi:MAG: TrpB-like pyridoxal phosphate-dependent enzyme [Deltaproteobacteria bacterium]|nr:TrpB-like pyridoxal phosphate-dependent enzyme [Deltaproteobacteria bacterium]